MILSREDSPSKNHIFCLARKKPGSPQNFILWGG
jgi:hypothetical protein